MMDYETLMDQLKYKFSESDILFAKVIPHLYIVRVFLSNGKTFDIPYDVYLTFLKICNMLQDEKIMNVMKGKPKKWALFDGLRKVFH